MDLIQDNPLTTKIVKKAFGVEHHPPDARQFAVEILDVRQALAQTGFADPTNTSEPNDRALLPRSFDQTQPEVPVYHLYI